MIEWLVLVLLVPAVLVPFVLVFGFSGCSLLFKPKLAKPSNLSAFGAGDDRIRLEWTHPGDGVTFEVTRVPDGGATQTTISTPDTSLLDDGLEEGTTYFYRVVAVSGSSKSDPTDEVSASTFRKAFEEALPSNRTRTDECIVLRIEAIRLFGGGSPVQITLQRPDGNLVINAMSISRPATDGNPYDSAEDPVPVLSAPLTLAPDPSEPEVRLPLVDFELNQEEDLLVAFDIGDPGRTSRSDSTSRVEAFRGPAGEALVAKRSDGYEADGENVYLVAKIHVP
jgi:hypothetical protein